MISRSLRMVTSVGGFCAANQRSTSGLIFISRVSLRRDHSRWAGQRRIIRAMRPPDRRSSGWFWLVQVAASVDAALLFAAGAYLRDAEALGLAFVVLLTLGWILFRPGRVIPVVVRALVFADVAIWMVPAAVINALSDGSLGSIALP